MEESDWPYDHATDPGYADGRPRQTPPPRSGLSRAAQAAKRASRGTARVVAKGSTSAFTGARRFTHSGGAGESGFSRLLELHAFNTAGDAAVAISLAGTLFFTVPTGEATGQVALFLAVTMLPFAIVAPLIGPFLDRFRRGRRWAIGATLAFIVRAIANVVTSIAFDRPLLSNSFPLVDFGAGIPALLGDALKGSIILFITVLPLAILAGVLLWHWRKANPPQFHVEGLIDV